MNTEKPVSDLLRRLVDGGSITVEVAEQLNELENQSLQLRAVKELPRVIREAVACLCERLGHPETAVMEGNGHAEAAAGTRAPEDFNGARGDVVPVAGGGGLGVSKTGPVRNKMSRFEWTVVIVMIAGMAIGLWRMNSSPGDFPISSQESVPDFDVPAPESLRWSSTGSRTIPVRWDVPYSLPGQPPVPTYHYNVYVAYADEPNSWGLATEKPVKGSEIRWTAPERRVYEFYVKAIDAQGRMSPPSNHIVVNLR